ncbi:MAG TPA: response regulator [Nitrospirales bacterium]|nr:response regulator [Nitrospirales bacterium]
MDRRRKPILVVEDDPVDREMIGQAFKRAAVESPVVTVVDGQEALDYLTAQVKDRRTSTFPAVILLDLTMPRMDGFEFLRRMKTLPDLATIPVVVLTTSEFNGDISQSYALGANSCITKPGDFERLVEIARAVDLYWRRLNRIPERR